MPIVFAGALVGACGLIGLPLTNGFVSKWLIYKTLILQGHPFLAFAALAGTWGTTLSLYKFIHNMFLGQLPERHKDVQKAPLSMQIPILVYSAIIVLFGILPGIPLKAISAITASLGLGALDVNIWGLASETGSLNTVNILFAVLAASVVAWMVFKAGKKSVRVSQEDNYAAGSAIPVGRYNYTAEFYSPLYRMIGRYLRDVVDEFYYWVAGRVGALCDGVRRVYTGDLGDYVVYILLFLALLVVSRIWVGPW